MPSTLNTGPLEAALLHCSSTGDLAGIVQLLSFWPGAQGSAHALPLQAAARHGHAECVRLLIPISDPQANDSRALLLAAGNGHAECVRLLIPVSDPTVDHSWALRLAAENGHEECVRLLLPMSKPDASFAALYWAAFFGHAECAKILMPSCNPKDKNSIPLAKALERGHVECAKLLIPVSDLNAVDPKSIAHAVEQEHVGVLALALTSEPSLANVVRPLLDPSIPSHAQMLDIIQSIDERYLLSAIINAPNETSAQSPAPRL